ncbi:MAG: aminotransferase class I/II-fold pyridoxal phosphate-dependent enzyme [Acidobacteria bacterium]|nr:aminotransferase class I/II-fold pyridoxal phosphate-dependent enzyme [Acidobacteriota bacterium]
MIDLRSDTVTKPTPEMRAAMAAAEVGDDVYGEDPTVNRLQERAAEVFEKEAALFVASGTMGNQIAVKVHTRPGDEVIIEARTHIYNYELGMAGILSGVTFRTIRSEAASGHLTWKEIAAACRSGDDHSAPTGLICLENTHNFGGGSVMNAEQCRDICENAAKLGVSVHIDGARIFNAAVAMDTGVAELTRYADSVQLCLSKGLGAPVGSVLVGSRDFINEAHLWRKRLGGGMRQAGIIAAAGLLALEDSPERLHEDHAKAKELAFGLASLPGIAIDPKSVMTNIVIFDVAETGKSPAQICDGLKRHGVLASGFDTSIRMVTHRDIGQNDVGVAVNMMKQVLV